MNEDAGYDVVAVLGQSNAQGSNTDGDPDGTDALGDRVDVFAATGADARRIVPAREPLAPLLDLHPPGGVGPGGEFARRLVAELPPGRRVLLVPAAVGGTGFRTHGTYPGVWAVDAHPPGVPNLFEAATALIVDALEAAGAGARLRAVLWHQGETDGGQGRTEAEYAADLDALVAGLRAAVPGAAEVPFVVGQLAVERRQAYPNHAGVAGALAATPSRVPRTGFADAPPAGYLNDGTTHFTAAGQRLLGAAYFAAYRDLVAAPVG